MASATTLSRTPVVPGPARFDVGQVTGLVQDNGFARVAARTMGRLLGAGAAAAGTRAFAASWDDLPLDGHMADGGRYRRRRHAVYTAEGERLVRQPHQPHYQSRLDNPLNGGADRWFAPVSDEVGEGPILRSAIGLLVSVADRLRPAAGRWRVEVHQFRIEARAGEAGRPTPEGMHRDGVDYVLVMLVGRHNVSDGVTTIADAAGVPLVRTPLRQRFEAMVLDDARVRHGVSPIVPLDPARPAVRDALVVTATTAESPGARPMVISHRS